MKKVNIIIPLIFAFIVLCQFNKAQAQNFEGVIHYEIPEMQGNQMGEMAYMIKGSKIRMEMGQGKQSSALLFFTDKSEMIVIIDQMKGYMKTDMNKSSGSDSNEWKDSQMQKTGQTKTIAGHPCEIWKVEKKDDTKYTLCMTKGLGTFVTPGNPMAKQDAPAWARKFAAEEYMPLEVIETSGGTESVQLRAISIEEKSLDTSLFEVPDGYRDMSSMLKQMQGKQ